MLAGCFGDDDSCTTDIFLAHLDDLIGYTETDLTIACKGAVSQEEKGSTISDDDINIEF